MSAQRKRSTKIVTFSLRPEEAREFDSIAQQEGRNKSEMFREMLRVYRIWRETQRSEARYDELSALLDRAEQTAPPVIADDVATFATAIDDFATALEEVDYDLDAIYSTPEGEQLAKDTSHALTPTIMNHLTGPCGLTPGSDS